MKNTILLTLVLALCIATEVTKADFTFGEPTNLGPTINSVGYNESPSISADGLSLYFNSLRPGGYGEFDIWMTTRATKADEWGEPVNLGPRVNSGYREQAPCISTNGLELYFASNRGYTDITFDIWVTTRETTDDDWGEPVKLGPNVNSSAFDIETSISSDGLSLFFGSNRAGGSGNADLFVTTRETINDPWVAVVNLGPTVNSSAHDEGPSISADGRTLFFSGWGMAPYRPGGVGDSDLWMTRRATTDDDWSTPVNLGPIVNSTSNDCSPNISADGSTLYFTSVRLDKNDVWDIWEVSIDPVVDLNGDGAVDSADMTIMIDHWGTDEALCDIGPTPLGDGIVDVQDLIVLAEHLLPVFPAHWELDETNGSIVYDSAGDHDGTLNGNPLWQPAGGKINGALQLDGVDDYVSTPFILDTISGALSAFAWIKGGGPGQVIVSQTNGTGWGSSWLCADASNGRLATALMDPMPALESEYVITDGAWHHIGLVWDKSYRYLYVDGAEVARDAVSISFTMPCDGGLYLGAGKTLDPASFFSGLIDDVRIYRRALSAEEIAAMAK
jgi:hypothetical protein